MALIIPPGYANVAWHFTMAGDPEEMVTTLGIDIGDYTGDNTQLANKMRSGFSTSFLLAMSNAVHLRYAVVYIGQDGGPPTVATSAAVDVAGGAAADSLPPNSAFLVRKRTDTAGRRGRGRFYLPGVPEEECDAVGNLTGPAVAGLVSAGTTFRSYLVGATDGGPVVPVVLHRSEGVGPEPLPTVITAFLPETKIATQRRRLRP